MFKEMFVQVLIHIVGRCAGSKRGARTPSEHWQSTLEQGTKPPNAQIGPCNELATHPGVYLAYAICKQDVNISPYPTFCACAIALVCTNFDIFLHVYKKLSMCVSYIAITLSCFCHHW